MRQITFGNTKEQHSKALATVGEIGVTPDGKVWRYGFTNEAIAKGNVAVRVADVDVDTVSSAVDDLGQITEIIEASAGWTPGDYIDAYGLVNDGTGEGQVFKVKSNNNDTLFLYDDYKLDTALSVADSDIVISRPYTFEKSAITVLDQILGGVAQVDFAAATYGWFLTEGYGIAIAGEVLVANDIATPGDDTEGQVHTINAGATGDLYSEVGRCVVPNTAADKGALLNVNIA